jgi:hypothetical protein
MNEETFPVPAWICRNPPKPEIWKVTRYRYSTFNLNFVNCHSSTTKNQQKTFFFGGGGQLEVTLYRYSVKTTMIEKTEKNIMAPLFKGIVS